MTDSERSLGERLRRGDPGAPGELASLYGDRLLRAAWFLCRNEADAQDLVQETLAESILAAPRFQERSEPYAWLYGILRRRFLLDCRRRRRFLRWLGLAGRPEAAERERAETASEEPGTAGGDFDLRGAVLNLPAKPREVLFLRYIEGRKISEIASLLSVSDGTVKSRLHYALRRMKTTFRPEGNAAFLPAGEKAHEV
jgi:RNA polymerase sigma-70 factor (ECF subfamily)